ncbi:MAG: hypothetical protein NT154_23545 [Verrucomicrobia bacterium]|nr:hypothetical protein [Verrucomicrobiota bacterium]
MITTSNAIYVTVAYRATATEFTVNTSSATRPVVTNVGNTGGHFSFDVLTTAGQTFTVVSSPNCALPIAQWSTVLTTNRPETTVHVIDPRPMTGQSMFYRVRSGT